MNPQLTDDAVADLPLAAARAELLEEIVSSPVAESTTTAPTRPHRTRRWLAPVAAAAAVAALVGLPAWLLAGPEQAREAGPAASAQEWLVLEAPGWEVDHVSVAGSEREVSYVRDGQQVDVHLRDAADRASYVRDRSRLDHPAIDPGTPVRLAGEEALLWAYDRRDHTSIGPVVGDVYAEVRGSGMGRRAYERLLDRLAWTDQAGFEAALPESYVTHDEAGPTIADMLVGIGLAPGADVPTSDESDPYQLGADVAGQVVCGWIEEYERAVEEGDERAAEIARANLRETPTWTFLNDMDAEGDYPEVVWEMSADVVAGRVPEGYRMGLGCE